MFNLNIRPTKFMNVCIVDKKSVKDLIEYNKVKYKRFNTLGTKYIDPLLIRFLKCDEIAVRWACEGYQNAPKYRLKIPHVSFLVTTKGLDQLVRYLENCRLKYDKDSEYWSLSFHQSYGKVDGTLNTVTWSLSTFLDDNKKEELFKIMCDEFDKFFP